MVEKHLLLLRHAKSAWLESGQGDHDRPLTARGARAAAVIGVYLSQLSPPPDLVLCSTAARARQTWDAIGVQLEAPPDVLFERGLYLAGPQALLACLRSQAAEHMSVLMIAHNPGLQALATLLSAGAINPHEKFPTGALAIFAGPDDPWSAFQHDRARLIDYTVPKAMV